MTFAEKLMELRRQHGWSQEELGDRLGVTRQTISKWELGSTTPEMEKLAAISELFGITTDELIKGCTPGPQIITTEKKPRTYAEYKSAKTWRGIPMVHINLKGTACGVVAIGLAARGIIAIGLASLGVVSLGLVTVGVLAVGFFAAAGVFSSAVFAAGVFALGSVTAGVFSLGGISTGWLSFGGLSVGKYAIGGFAQGTIAVGGSVNGTIAVGEAVKGEITITSPIPAAEFRDIVLQRLPHTPKFIIDIFSWFAENMDVSDVSIQVSPEDMIR